MAEAEISSAFKKRIPGCVVEDPLVTGQWIKIQEDILKSISDGQTQWFPPTQLVYKLGHANKL